MRKLHTKKVWQFVCDALLMSHGSSRGHGKVMRGKAGVASMASAVWHCNRENQ